MATLCFNIALFIVLDYILKNSTEMFYDEKEMATTHRRRNYDHGNDHHPHTPFTSSAKSWIRCSGNLLNIHYIVHTYRLVITTYSDHWKRLQESTVSPMMQIFRRSCTTGSIGPTSFLLTMMGRIKKKNIENNLLLPKQIS